MTIAIKDALYVVTYLAKAGYVSQSDGQADVWADVINDAAPYATPDMLRQAAREIAREPHRWIATGDIVKILHRIRTEQIEAEERRQLRAVPDIDVTPPERIREPELRAAGDRRPYQVRQVRSDVAGRLQEAAGSGMSGSKACSICREMRAR
jgi:hypothetical protein